MKESEEVLQDYYEVIGGKDKQVDLLKIYYKLQDQKYKTYGSFIDDVKLMFNNAILYHDEGDHILTVCPTTHLINDYEQHTRPVVIVDIGCNSGDLSLGLLSLLEDAWSNQADRTATEVQLLGIDIDNVLIDKAKKKLRKVFQ